MCPRPIPKNEPVLNQEREKDYAAPKSKPDNEPAAPELPESPE